jgi:signal transduction histidine kinase
VRVRLGALILCLMAAALIAMGLPLAAVISNAYNRDMFLDRLNDTARFAAITAQADSTNQLQNAGTELRRYHAIYGIDCFALADNSSIRLFAAGHPLPSDAIARQRIASALGGRRSRPPAAGWPWSSRPMVVAEPIVRGGDVVGAMVTVSPTDRMRHRVLLAWTGLLVLGLAALAVCAFVADRLARWVLRPVQVLDVATNEVATGRLDARVAAESGPPELRRLAASFNGMAGHVQASLEQQRAFVADASHQLRNPLAALLLRLDDLSSRVPHELRTDTDQAVDEGRRLVDILERLLELARAEHAGQSIGACDLVELVQQRLETWRPIADARDVAVVVRAPASLTVWVDEAALSGAVDVVIDNALKFSPLGGAVEVTVTGQGTLGVVSVRDSGPGLSADELGRVGDRFWRSASGQNVPGFGLGLSIARALLEPAGGALEFRTQPGGGLTVEVLVRREPVSSSAGGTT